jgi:hypothetical protein
MGFARLLCRGVALAVNLAGVGKNGLAAASTPCFVAPPHIRKNVCLKERVVASAKAFHATFSL